MLDDATVPVAAPAADLGGARSRLPRPITDPADDGCDLWGSRAELVVNDEVVRPDAVAGRIADMGCIKLRLRLVAPVDSRTWPGMLATGAVAIVGGAGSGSKLIVVVVGGCVLAAVPVPAPAPAPADPDPDPNPDGVPILALAGMA